MQGKIIALILALALTGAGLLVVRQQRLHAVHEMTRALQRADRVEIELWRMHTEIAGEMEPPRLVQLADERGGLKPIPLDWTEPAVAPQRSLVTIDGPRRSIGVAD